MELDELTYELRFERRPDYLHATVTGDNNREVVAAYMEDIVAECKKRDCFRVLIEERLQGPRLQAMEVFSLASEGSMKVLGVFDAIAYVDEEMGELGDFVETVAVNRGLPIGIFGTVGEARDWLAKHKPGADDANIFKGQEPAND